MNPILDSGNGSLKLFSNTVGYFSFNDLVIICTIFAKCYTPKRFDKAIFLEHYHHGLSNIRLGIQTSNKIVRRLVELTNVPFVLMLLFGEWKAYLYQPLNSPTFVKSTVLQQIN